MDSDAGSSEEEGRPCCDLCGTVLTLRDGTKTCFCRLRGAGFRQTRSRFYNKDGDYYQVTGIAVPRWLFPNTLADSKQDAVSRDTFPGIAAFFAELYRPKALPSIREDTEAEEEAENNGSDDSIPYQVLEEVEGPGEVHHHQGEAPAQATPPQHQVPAPEEVEDPDQEESPRFTRGGTLLGRPPRGRKKRGRI